MALIKCPECGKKISDQAEACIHCGFPLSKLKKEEPVVDKQPEEEVKQEPQVVEETTNNNQILLKRGSASFAVYIIVNILIETAIGVGIELLVQYFFNTDFQWLVIFGIFVLLVIFAVSISAMVDGIVCVAKNYRRLDKHIDISSY